VRVFFIFLIGMFFFYLKKLVSGGGGGGETTACFNTRTLPRRRRGWRRFFNVLLHPANLSTDTKGSAAAVLVRPVGAQ
jgi:hypothetical protein